MFKRCQLLRYTLFDRNIHKIVSVLQESELYLLVSDGGADRKYGSFGWTLGCPDGRRLAQGWGSVFGYNPQSYRAEIFILFFTAPSRFPPAIYKSTAITSDSFRKWRNFGNINSPPQLVAWTPNGTCCMQLIFSFSISQYSHQCTMSRVTRIARLRTRIYLWCHK